MYINNCKARSLKMSRIIVEDKINNIQITGAPYYRWLTIYGLKC